MTDSTTYNLLIDRAKERQRPPGYYERHHIIPRSMGGNDDSDNIVNLTVKEHVLAHKLLYRLFRHDYPNLIYAIYAFYQDANKERIKFRSKHRFGGGWLRRAKSVRDGEVRAELGRHRLLIGRMNKNIL